LAWTLYTRCAVEGAGRNGTIEEKAGTVTEAGEFTGRVAVIIPIYNERGQRRIRGLLLPD